MHPSFPNSHTYTGVLTSSQETEPLAYCISLIVLPIQSQCPAPSAPARSRSQMTESCLAHGAEWDRNAPSIQPCPVTDPPSANWLKRVFRPRAPHQELFPDGCKTD